MKTLKYTFSVLLILWGLLITWTKLFSVGPHFPFLTVITIVAIISGINKSEKSSLIFFIASCLWILFSAETFGFVLFFDSGNYQRMLAGIIPLLLSSGVLLSIKYQFNLANTFAKKLMWIPLLVAIGIGSYVYKPTLEEVNCWYYFEQGNSYEVLFAETPERTFKVELSSVELKEEVKAEALQYEGRNGYYCPETKVRVVTRFGEIVAAKIISFRNSEIDKKLTFSDPTSIPLDKVNGKLEILKPFILRLWN